MYRRLALNKIRSFISVQRFYLYITSQKMQKIPSSSIIKECNLTKFHLALTYLLSVSVGTDVIWGRMVWRVHTCARKVQFGRKLYIKG